MSRKREVSAAAVFREEVHMSGTKTRTEHDLIGSKEVPADAYYGVQTARALENFHISGVELRLYPNIIKALGMVKLAAARANFDCGQFSQEILARHGRRLPGDSWTGKLHDSSGWTCSRAAPARRRT